MASSQNSSGPISSAPRPSKHLDDEVGRSGSVDGDGGASASNSSSESESAGPKKMKLQRPQLPTRKSSGTIIVHRDDPNIQLVDEDYGPEDARTMSPRRTSEEVDRLGENARQALLQ
jgi:hypothetical protein